jgi:hypothetical protein
VDSKSFSCQLDELTVKYPHKSEFEAAYAFLDLHLKWADAAEASEPQKALEQYRLAEDCQRTIGTFATGSGEGLASMAALYKIMGKRADLEEKLADSVSTSAEATEHLKSALAIWQKISADPNRLGDRTPAKSNIQRLQLRIAVPKSM